MSKQEGTLVILTRNEINGLKAIFGKIPVDKVNDVFAIDYNSSDGTLEFFKKKHIRVVQQENKGRAEAFRIGCRNAKSENIVFFSPDGNEDPGQILPLLECLNKGYDMAIASRFMKESRAEDEGIIALRGFGNKTFTQIANMLWGGKLTDSINGFRAIKKKKFWELNPDTEGFGIEYQLSIRALKRRFKIKEIPTIEGNRVGGQSTAKTFDTGMLFLKIIMHELKVGKKF